MASSTNFEGYNFALLQAWKKSGHSPIDAPSKSSLSEFREKVSYKFFENIFSKDLNRYDEHRQKYLGHYIYAVDGDQYDLPPSKDILEKGYIGWPCRKNQETHYLKMYTCHAIDVVSGILKEFSFSSDQEEVHQARAMVERFEENSIALYDRLHCSYNLVFAHKEAKNYFIVRARSNGVRARREFKKFRESRKTSEHILLTPFLAPEKSPLPVRLVKVKNPRTKEDLIFMTNLPEEKYSNDLVATFYQRRWEIEGVFKSLTSIFKLEQWHSKKLNGILQEIYAMLWLHNASKMECLQLQKKRRWLDQKYVKTNFKLCAQLIMDNLPLLLESRFKVFQKILDYWLNRTRERRKHLSRHYPRVLKRRGQDYGWANLVPRRA